MRKLDVFLYEYPAEMRKSILSVDAKSLFTGCTVGMWKFKFDMVKMYLQDFNEAAVYPSSQSKLNSVLSSLCPEKGDMRVAGGNLQWRFESGVLTLANVSWGNHTLLWGTWVDRVHYPMLAALTVAFDEQNDNDVSELPADVRVALEELADVSFLRLLRTERARMLSQVAAWVSRTDLFEVLWGLLDLKLLAAGDPATIGTYLSLSELERFQAQVLMSYRKFNVDAFHADSRVDELDPEFSVTALGLPAVLPIPRDSEALNFSTYADLMEHIAKRYVEHQAYVNDPVNYLEVEDESLARCRAMNVKADAFTARVLSEYPVGESSANSDVTLERFVWLHSQGKLGTKPADIKEAIDSLPSHYKILLVGAAPTHEIMSIYNDAIINEF